MPTAKGKTQAETLAQTTTRDDIARKPPEGPRPEIKTRPGLAQLFLQHIGGQIGAGCPMKVRIEGIGVGHACGVVRQEQGGPGKCDKAAELHIVGTKFPTELDASVHLSGTFSGSAEDHVGQGTQTRRPAGRKCRRGLVHADILPKQIQGGLIATFYAESHRSAACPPHEAQQGQIHTIDPALTLPFNGKPSRKDTFTDFHHPFAAQGEVVIVEVYKSNPVTYPHLQKLIDNILRVPRPPS